MRARGPSSPCRRPRSRSGAPSLLILVRCKRLQEAGSVASAALPCQIAPAGAPHVQRSRNTRDRRRTGVTAERAQQRLRGDPAQLAVVAVERSQRRVGGGGGKPPLGGERGATP